MDIPKQHAFRLASSVDAEKMSAAVRCGRKVNTNLLHLYVWADPIDSNECYFSIFILLFLEFKLNTYRKCLRKEQEILQGNESSSSVQVKQLGKLNWLKKTKGQRRGREVNFNLKSVDGSLPCHPISFHWSDIKPWSSWSG